MKKTASINMGSYNIVHSKRYRRRNHLPSNSSGKRRLAQKVCPRGLNDPMKCSGMSHQWLQAACTRFTCCCFSSIFKPLAAHLASWCDLLGLLTCSALCCLWSTWRKQLRGRITADAAVLHAEPHHTKRQLKPLV